MAVVTAHLMQNHSGCDSVAIVAALKLDVEVLLTLPSNTFQYQIVGYLFVCLFFE